MHVLYSSLAPLVGVSRLQLQLQLHSTMALLGSTLLARREIRVDGTSTHMCAPMSSRVTCVTLPVTCTDTVGVNKTFPYRSRTTCGME